LSHLPIFGCKAYALIHTRCMLEIELSYNWMYIFWIFKKNQGLLANEIGQLWYIICHKVSIKVKDSIINEYDRNPFLNVNYFK
jgi:hypothetical protein